MNRSDIRARIAAVLVGVALLVFGASVPGLWFGDNVLLLFLSDITIYSIAGWILGFVWPNGGWHLGLYLAAVWPPVLLFGAFLAWEQPTIKRATWINIVGYLLIVFGACTGSALGALIARKARKSPHLYR
jgi:hypothetical protein